MEWIWAIIVLLVSYLIGSISTAILVGRILAGDDIRSHGSGNAGATNALRSYGKKAALFVVLGDCLKAAVSVLLGWLIAKMTSLNVNHAVYAAGIGAVLGHNFPVYFKFRGGKGVLVSMMAMMFADWRIGVAVLLFALALMAITRYVSLGSMAGATLFWVLSLIFHFGDGIYLAFATVMAGTLIGMHHTNIKRLLSGTESKLGQKKA